MDIKELDFTVRTYNALKVAGIKTVEQLDELSTLDILKIKNVGIRAITEILESREQPAAKIRLASKERTSPERSMAAYLEGAGAMKQDILLELMKLERGLVGIQKAPLVAARRVIEKMKAPSMPILIACEGYQMFRGTMQVSYRGTAQAEDITGDWLYRPDTRCWYCRGRSYPAEICEIVEGV